VGEKMFTGITGYLTAGVVLLFLMVGLGAWYYKTSYESLLAKNAEISQQLTITTETLNQTKEQIQEIAEQQKILNNSLDAIRKKSLTDKRTINQLNLSKETIPDNKEAEQKANEEILKSLRLGDAK
jgi:hypothetical protein